MNDFENISPTSHDGVSEGELATSSVVSFILLNFRVLIFCTLVGGILGFFLTALLAKQWEASALIRVGRLGNNIEPTLQVVDQIKSRLGNNIEPTLQVVDRIKSKSFQIDLLKQLKISYGQNNNIDDFSRWFKVRLEKSDLISITLRSESAHYAKLILSGAVEQLKINHIKMMAPTIKRWRQDLALINQELEIVSLQRKKLLDLSAKQINLVNDKSLLQAALLRDVLFMRENEFHALFDRKRMLEDQLSIAQTFPTDVLGRVEVSANPVFPVNHLFLLAGLFAGLFFGLAVAVLKPRSANAKK